MFLGELFGLPAALFVHRGPQSVGPCSGSEEIANDPSKSSVAVCFDDLLGAHILDWFTWGLGGRAIITFQPPVRSLTRQESNLTLSPDVLVTSLRRLECDYSFCPENPPPCEGQAGLGGGLDR